MVTAWRIPGLCQSRKILYPKIRGLTGFSPQEMKCRPLTRTAFELLLSRERCFIVHGAGGLQEGGDPSLSFLSPHSVLSLLHLWQ